MTVADTPATDATAPSEAAVKLFEVAFGATWRRGPIPTALDVLEADLRPIGAWHSPRLMPEPANRGGTESPYAWTRPLTRSELERRYVVGFDKHAAYLGVLGGLELGIGEPVHNDNARILSEGQSHRPGYWRVRCHWPPPAHAFPDPLKRKPWDQPDPAAIPEGKWITTPTLELALEQGYELEVLESWTWPVHRRVLRRFGERCRSARRCIHETELLFWHTDTDDAWRVRFDEAMRMLKHTYAPVLGGFLARYVDRNAARRPPWYRPDWRHHIIAKARANLWRNLAMWRPLGLEPIGIYNDAFYVAADELGGELAQRFGIPTGDALSGYAISPAVPLGGVLRDGRLSWPRVFGR